MVDENSYRTEPTRETDGLEPVGRDRIGASLLISKRDRGLIFGFVIFLAQFFLRQWSRPDLSDIYAGPRA